MLTGKYLVTGATGTMGTHALLRLKDKPGITVRAVYHKRRPRIFAKNFQYVWAELTNPEDCKNAVTGMDYVLMFAGILSTAPRRAEDPVSHVTTNMIMNSLTLEASYFAGVKKFLWLSSTTGYPMIEGMLHEENMFDGDPPDNYFSVGWMTRYTEVLCRMYAKKLKNPITTIVLRPTTIYSEYGDFNLRTCHVLPAMIRKVIERHKPIKVWGSREVKRDLLHGDDVFDACLLALEKVKDFNVFNIGFGKEYSINEMLKIIIETDKFDDHEIVYDESKPKAVETRIIDFSRSKTVLGFKPKTPLKEGIEKMIEWYRRNPWPDD